MEWLEFFIKIAFYNKCCFIIIVGVIGLLILGGIMYILNEVAESTFKEKIAKLEKENLECEKKIAEAEYKLSLAQLIRNPENANLKLKALELGRIYSKLSCNEKGEALFDEVALSNDINAACGSVASVTKENDNRSIEDRLKELLNLKENGLIKEQDYETKKQKILDEI